MTENSNIALRLSQLTLKKAALRNGPLALDNGVSRFTDLTQAWTNAIKRTSQGGSPESRMLPSTTSEYQLVKRVEYLQQQISSLTNILTVSTGVQLEAFNQIWRTIERLGSSDGVLHRLTQMKGVSTNDINSTITLRNVSDDIDRSRSTAFHITSLALNTVSDIFSFASTNAADIPVPLADTLIGSMFKGVADTLHSIVAENSSAAYVAAHAATIQPALDRLNQSIRDHNTQINDLHRFGVVMGWSDLQVQEFLNLTPLTAYFAAGMAYSVNECYSTANASSRVTATLKVFGRPVYIANLPKDVQNSILTSGDTDQIGSIGTPLFYDAVTIVFDFIWHRSDTLAPVFDRRQFVMQIGDGAKGRAYDEFIRYLRESSHNNPSVTYTPQAFIPKYELSDLMVVRTYTYERLMINDENNPSNRWNLTAVYDINNDQIYGYTWESEPEILSIDGFNLLSENDIHIPFLAVPNLLQMILWRIQDRKVLYSPIDSPMLRVAQTVVLASQDEYSDLELSWRRQEDRELVHINVFDKSMQAQLYLINAMGFAGQAMVQRFYPHELASSIPGLSVRVAVEGTHPVHGMLLRNNIIHGRSADSLRLLNDQYGQNRVGFDQFTFFRGTSQSIPESTNGQSDILNLLSISHGDTSLATAIHKMESELINTANGNDFAYLMQAGVGLAMATFGGTQLSDIIRDTLYTIAIETDQIINGGGSGYDRGLGPPIY